MAKTSTKVQNLRKLGVKKTAVGCGVTRKLPWRSSKTPEIQQALSNVYTKKVRSSDCSALSFKQSLNELLCGLMQDSVDTEG